MLLSLDYSRVALFETQSEEVAPQNSSGDVQTQFRVGPFLYDFSISEGEGGTFGVSFGLSDIVANSDEELVQIVSQIEKKPVNLEQAKHIKGYIELYYGDVVGLPEGYALKVFGTVLGFVQNFVRQHHPRCLVFTASETKRAKIYERMIKRSFPEATIEVDDPGDDAVKIVACMPEETNG